MDRFISIFFYVVAAVHSVSDIGETFGWFGDPNEPHASHATIMLISIGISHAFYRINQISKASVKETQE